MKIFVSLLFLLIVTLSKAQTVGVVLSGGGAAGFAHIGVLKALEENNIPIDYITGTSAGALVGGLYAAGLSIAEIEALSTSESFFLMVSGDIERNFKFNLRRDDQNAELVSLAFSRDSILTKNLPTNFITPALFDYEMLRVFGTIGASCQKNFDSLFVPFRCVASDIKNKRPYVFSQGDLNLAIRASMTYPFYINPIRVNGLLMFDGGLYNNFPADVMYNDFNPDYIIGSNVSENNINPNEDDLLSQMKAAMVRETNFEIPCESGIMIKHEREIGTFDFDKVQEAIDQGYFNTLKMIDSIKLIVKREQAAESLSEARTQFKSRIKPLQISSSNSVYEDGKKATFVNYPLTKKLSKGTIDEKMLKKYYFQLYGTPQVKYLLPSLNASSDSTYELNLKVRRTRDLSLSVGGHVSSRPVNMGYIGLSYFHVNRLAWRAHAESYFGKFYGSGKALIDIHIPTRLPFVITPYFNLNRWDYFRSFATFFEPVRPSFLVQEEMHTGAKIQIPLSMTVKAGLDFKYFDLTDRYYQTENFSASDTADFTNFYGRSVILSIGHNSMNRKQYASEGSRLNISLRIVQGTERSVSGSTAPIPFDEEFQHQWVNFQFDAHKYFALSSKYSIGVHSLAAFNSQSLFRNYVASILAMTDFSPIPDAKTFFMEEYRAPQYLAGGLNQVFNIVKSLDFRVDAYVFQPIIVLRNNSDGTFQYSQYQLQPKFMGSTSLIYHTLIGPLRATLNYFPEQNEPFSFLLSYGYILFNDRAIR